jgi:hypothetical protein
VRNVTPNIFEDEFFGSLTHTQRLLWLGLLLKLADDQGRIVDNVALMPSQIFPYDPDVTVDEIEKGLRIFIKARKIDRYVAGTNGTGKKLIQITNWWKYQKAAQWASASLFPAPAGWVDRVRAHMVGHGQNIVTINWDKPGGYVATRQPHAKPLRSQRNKATTKRLRSREDEDEDEDEDKGGGIKTPESSGAAPRVFSKGEPKGFQALRRAGGKTNGK